MLIKSEFGILIYGYFIKRKRSVTRIKSFVYFMALLYSDLKLKQEITPNKPILGANGFNSDKIKTQKDYIIILNRKFLSLKISYLTSCFLEKELF